MADPTLDLGAVPTLELTIDYVAPSLTCAGTIDAQTRHHVLEAVEELLDRRPPRMTVDVSAVDVGDRAGAVTFGAVQRRAREAGTRLDWVGPEPGRLADVVPPDRLSLRALPPLAAAGLDGHRDRVAG